MAVLTVTKENFESEVLNSTQKVLVDFWAPWCGPCRMLAPVVDEVAEEREDIKVCKINVDEEPELAIKYGIATIPTLLVFKDGRIANKTLGAQPKEHILNLF